MNFFRLPLRYACMGMYVACQSPEQHSVKIFGQDRLLWGRFGSRQPKAAKGAWVEAGGGGWHVPELQRGVQGEVPEGERCVAGGSLWPEAVKESRNRIQKMVLTAHIFWCLSSGLDEVETSVYLKWVVLAHHEIIAWTSTNLTTSLATGAERWKVKRPQKWALSSN